jgi:hypothetical protein
VDAPDAKSTTRQIWTSFERHHHIQRENKFAILKNFQRTVRKGITLMAKNQIVIVTEKLDPHADEVIVKLNELGYDPIRLNTDEIPINTGMHFRLNGSQWDGYIKVMSSGREIDVSNIRSIWWRRPSEFTFPPEFSQQEEEFARKEINHAVAGLWEVLRYDCYWVSYPSDIRQAGFKPGQLSRAAKMGFDVPRTIITTDPNEVRAFYDACDGNIIFKVMSDPFLAMDKVEPVPAVMDDPNAGLREISRPRGTFTTIIGEKELAALDSVRYVNCQFQEMIPKAIELRVVVIGDDVFACEIHSQTHEKTMMDWRHYDVEIPYRKAILPIDIEQRCLDFVHSYNLQYSAIDFILTPDGRYVFLENNSNGQFLFLQIKVPELKMVEALAACLIRGSNS